METREGVIIDCGLDGRILSPEVLDASEHVAEPATIVYEMKQRRKVSFLAVRLTISL
ncbi:MAG: hypothetical protein ABIH46_05755 [Chloroflexota bacterium]